MNYLILTSNYDLPTDANGLCVRNLVDEIENRGDTAIVISECLKCSRKYEQNQNTYYLVAPILKRMLSKSGNEIGKTIIRLGHSFFAFFCYPNVSPIRSYKEFKLACEIIDNKNIDVVVGSYRPFESIYTALKLKKKYSDSLFIVAHHLDLLLNPGNKGVLERYKEYRASKVFSTEIDRLDLIILPTTEGNKYPYDNVITAGFPVITNQGNEKYYKNVFDPNYINVTYIGSLDQKNRNPKNVLSLIALLNQYGQNVRLHIWGKISDSTTQQMIDEDQFTYYHGFVDNKYIKDIYNNSDYLINISNRITYNMLPSKIFNMFVSNKKIIHYIFNELDVSVPYIKDDSNSFLYKDQSNNNQIEDLIDWMNDKQAQNYTKQNKYLEYTASYLLDSINGAYEYDNIGK